MAARTGTTVEILVQASCLPNANRIETGQQLRVPRLPVYIRVFTATDPGADAIAMATRAARLGVTWAVDYRPQGTNLVFEQVMANGTTYNVELPRSFTQVPSSGAGQVAPLLQRGDVTQLRLRLRLVLNADSRTLDSREITVPVYNQPLGSNYVVSDAAQCLSAPYRETFLGVGKRGYVVNSLPFQGLPLTNGAGFGGELLGLLPAGTAFTVSDGPFCFRPAVGTSQSTWRQWRARVDGTGQEGWLLEYDQPASGDFRAYLQAYQQTVVYEGAACYQDPFPASNGLTVGGQAHLLFGQSLWNAAGPGAAGLDVYVAAGENVELQQGPYCYRDQPSGPGWRQWLVRQPSTGREGWAFEYGSTDQYMEPVASGPAPAIVTFSLSPEAPVAGETVTITWEVQNAAHVEIAWRHSVTNADLAPIDPANPELPPTGHRTLVLPSAAGTFSVVLTIPGAVGRQIDAPLACVAPWLGDSSLLNMLCPSSAAASVQAAFEPFEYGMMIWHNSTVWVLYDAGTSGKVFADTWAGEEITFGQTPPAGRYLPVNGFGRVWVDNADVRQTLSWATAPEQGYTAQLQQAPGFTGGTAYLITLPDGRKLALRQTNSELYWQPIG